MLWKSYSLCSCSVVKLHEVTQMFVMVDHVKKVIPKKSCGEYGSFEHLFFPFFFFFCLFMMSW